MHKNFFIISLFICLPFFAHGQAVGYQGKKCVLSLGYMPLNNLSGKLLGVDWSNYQLSDVNVYEIAPYELVVRHTPFVSVEYVVSRQLSLWVRYNPLSVSTNIYWNDFVAETSGLVQANTSGNMFSLGMRKYMRSTAAPLSSYFNFYVSMYPTHSDFSISDESPIPTPQIILDQTYADKTLFGVSVAYGYQNVFWDKVTLDLSIALGYFFGEEYDYWVNDGSIGENIFIIPGSALSGNFPNIQSLFFASPSIGVGYLIF